MMPDKANNPFLVIAHRGAPNHAPENTLATFDKALELGLRHIELDAQLSSDGVAVVFHDSDLDRTSDGSGPLASRTLAELMRLDIGAWFDEEFRGQRMPTLEEVLTRYRGRAYLHLELKSGEEALPGIVAELLAATGWPTIEDVRPGEGPGWPDFGVTISSFHKTQLDRMRPLLPRIPLAWLVQELSAEMLDESEKSSFQFICPRADTVTGEAIRETKRRGFHIRAWGLRSNEQLDHLVACGVEGTTCDWPNEAREYLAGRGVATYP
jgi:glycerophosphoryl diester phosphodiesterase